MRQMLFLCVGAALIFGSAPAFADDRMPAGTFRCTLLMSPTLTGTSSDEFVPSILGATTFDGSGGYTRDGKSGSVRVENGVVKFTSGEMADIVAILKSDPQGRAYLHIDGEVSTPPAGAPKPADFVCYKQ